MKRTIIFLILITALHYTGISQCVNCDGGTASQINSASILGVNNTATGIGAIAGGKESKALGDFSVALGYYAIANHSYSFAIGKGLLSLVPNSFTIGNYLETRASNSFVLGRGYDDENRLINTIPASMMIGFMSTAPTLFISESGSSPSYKNRTGKIGIGNVTEPEAKLHIRADDNENAELYLQSHLWNSASIASIFIGNKNYGVEANGRLGLVFNSENNYVFGNSNVGILI